jgi:hypothetical protein
MKFYAICGSMQLEIEVVLILFKTIEFGSVRALRLYWYRDNGSGGNEYLLMPVPVELEIYQVN